MECEIAIFVPLPSTKLQVFTIMISHLHVDEGRQSFISSGGCKIFANGLKVASGELSDAIGECLMDQAEQGTVLVCNETLGKLFLVL